MNFYLLLFQAGRCSWEVICCYTYTSISLAFFFTVILLIFAFYSSPGSSMYCIPSLSLLCVKRTLDVSNVEGCIDGMTRWLVITTLAIVVDMKRYQFEEDHEGMGLKSLCDPFGLKKSTFGGLKVNLSLKLWKFRIFFLENFRLWALRSRDMRHINRRRNSRERLKPNPIKSRKNETFFEFILSLRLVKFKVWPKN